MDRRAFIRALASGPLLAPLAATAQTTASVRRIGWLAVGDPPPPHVIEQRYPPLKALGWIEGKNLIVEQRYANNSAERLRVLADELVRLDVELIVTQGTAATLAAKNATTTIPIVMYSAGDPVGAGLVASLAKPGGNVTGYALLSPESDAKRLSLLRELLPATQRVGELVNSTSPYQALARARVEQAYRTLGMQPIFVEVARASEIDDAVADVARQRAQALHVPNDDLFFNNLGTVMRAASKHALPTVVDRSEFLEAGGLLSYGFSLVELRRRGAAFIDKVLRGANPAALPVEQPTQFEIGINLKTAQTLGITVPQSLLVRADVVIR
jgi:putative ABC transport system substrate-binding protein